ncbi:hypothetical protein [Vampirovibrio sp.]|uniref:hypothetical protein n=1 Tax=Vampirovibrio sp. TaxID=2717857 RepID=UPI0035943A33
MQYSYESWLNQPLDNAEALEAPENPSQAENLNASEAAQSFPFSEDLKALEQNLPLSFDEGLQAYRQHQGPLQAGLSLSDSAEQAHWEDLAKLVADHVLAYMLDNPLQNELQDLRLQNGQHYQDNRRMAEQVRKLVAENTQLRTALHQAEKALSHFHPVAGGLYVKR